MIWLPDDTPVTAETLDSLLARSHAHNDVAQIVSGIAAALPKLADRLEAGKLPSDPAAHVGTNDSGDRQKALDAAAHDYMLDVLRRYDVRAVLSEEAPDIIELNSAGAWDVAIDPIDGSGSIGIGAPLGMLFSIMPASKDAAFLRPGHDIVAAGYGSFGHSTDFCFALDGQVSLATFNRACGEFRVTHDHVQLHAEAKTIAYNASNERHWPQALQTYVQELRAGRDGPRGKDFNMRWLAAAVGELHRILIQGGMFMYPADKRNGYQKGRLRLLYEAAPIAYVVEQAGGAATDGTNRLLDVVPDSLHQNVPLFFGARDEVERVTGRVNQA